MNHYGTPTWNELRKTNANLVSENAKLKVILKEMAKLEHPLIPPVPRNGFVGSVAVGYHEQVVADMKGTISSLEDRMREVVDELLVARKCRDAYHEAYQTELKNTVDAKIWRDDYRRTAEGYKTERDAARKSRDELWNQLILVRQAAKGEKR